MKSLDELNKLFGAYFKIMAISEEDKKKRIDCAWFFYDAVWYVLTMIRLENDKGRLADKDSYRQSLEFRIIDSLEENNLPVDEEYINKVTEEVIDTTFRHLDDDEYYLSQDRAVLIAQNEANTVMNGVDFFNAKQSGKKYKVWQTEMDSKVRPWHEEVNGMRIPIDEYFYVGNDQMKYPHDYNASAENVVNCRCSCVYE